jgi:hypothetical protein
LIEALAAQNARWSPPYAPYNTLSSGWNHLVSLS